MKQTSLINVNRSRAGATILAGLIVAWLLVLPAQAQDAERGARVFAEIGCTACHGAAAGGGSGPTLAGTRLSLDEVRSQIRNPRGSMPDFGPDRLSDEEIADIFAWLQQDEVKAGYSTWFGTDLINLPTPLMPGKKTLEVHFSHRFTDSIADSGREGLWGLDSFAIPVFWFAYGITDWLEVQGGRSSINATWDYGAKVRLLDEGDVALPVSASVVASGYFLDRDAALNKKRFSLEVPVGVRVHERVSLVAVPFLATNTDNQALPSSDGYSAAIGIGGTFRFTPRQSIDVEWITNLGGYEQATAVDIWQVFWGMKVGGHLFQVGVTNSFLSTPEQMAGGHVETGIEGEIRLGFNLVRQFRLGGG